MCTQLSGNLLVKVRAISHSVLCVLNLFADYHRTTLTHGFNLTYHDKNVIFELLYIRIKD